MSVLSVILSRLPRGTGRQKFLLRSRLAYALSDGDRSLRCSASPDPAPGKRRRRPRPAAVQRAAGTDDTPYTGAIELDAGGEYTITVLAVKDGFGTSQATGVYSLNLGRVAEPSFELANGIEATTGSYGRELSVSIVTAPSNATIYYTVADDGSAPRAPIPEAALLVVGTHPQHLGDSLTVRIAACTRVKANFHSAVSWHERVTEKAPPTRQGREHFRASVNS